MFYKILITIFILTLLSYFLIGLVITFWIRINNPINKIYSNQKTLYLTFDDGVDTLYTPQLLDLLKSYGIKASFFILASTVNENRRTLQLMKEDGHLIGLHSYNHKNQILQSPFSLIRDFKKSLEIFNVADFSIKYYRPPWGHVRPLGLYLCKIYKLKMVLWNVIIQDWQKNTTVEVLCDKVKRRIVRNSVICLHDGRGKNHAPLKTLEMLKIMIPVWEKEGFNFETIDHIY